MKTFCVWHTNDIHSHFDAFSSIAAMLKEKRNPDTDLTLDAGDFCDQRDVMISGTDGIGGIHLLQKAGYDAMSIGNNEFFCGIDWMSDMSAQGLPLLACNLFQKNGEAVPHILPYVILQKNSLRFLIIGVSPFWKEEPGSSVFLDMVNLATEDPCESIRRILKQESGKYDFSILLSHAGLKKDRMIAQNAAGLNLIIGGHSHTDMEQAEQVNGIWIHQSGCYGETLGKTEVTWNDGQICGMHSENLRNEQHPDPEIDELYRNEKDKGEKALSVPLYRLSQALGYDAYHECAAVNAVCDAMYREYPCDFSMINNGILSGPIEPVISKMNLLKLSPSGLNPTLVQWHGSQIKEAAIRSFDEKFISQSGKGSGYRGTVLGSLCFSENVRIVQSPFSMSVSGKPLEDDRLYTVMSDDYLQRGSGYDMLGLSRGKTEFFNEYIRDLLERTLCDPDLIQSAGQMRIEYEQGKK